MITHTLDEATQTLRLEVAGDLLSTNFDKVNAEISAILEAEAVHKKLWSILLLDLTASKLIDSMGLNVVVGLIKKGQARSARIRAQISSQMIHRTFLFTRLEKYMDVEFVEQKK